MCTAIERKFCGLFEDDIENCQKLSYIVQFAIFWQVTGSVNKPNYQILVGLKSTSSMLKYTIQYNLTIPKSLLRIGVEIQKCMLLKQNQPPMAKWPSNMSEAKKSIAI